MIGPGGEAGEYKLAEKKQVRESYVEFRWRNTLKRFDDDGEGRGKYLVIFWTKLAIRAVQKFIEFGTEISEDAEEIKNPSVLWARANTWIRTVAGWLTEWEARGDQMQRLYAETQGNILELSMEQFIRNVMLFTQHWVGDEFILRQIDNLTRLVEFPTTREK